MKKTYMLLLAGVAAAGLAGCAGSPHSEELSQTTVEYGCGPGGEQPLTVRYTFRGDEAVSARVMHMNQVIDLARVAGGSADMVGNTFRGSGYTWSTGKFDRDNVDEVDGDMLTQDVPPAAGMPGGVQGSPYGGGMPAAGTPGMTGNVLLRDCRVS